MEERLVAGDTNKGSVASVAAKLDLDIYGKADKEKKIQKEKQTQLKLDQED